MNISRDNYCFNISLYRGPTRRGCYRVVDSGSLKLGKKVPRRCNRYTAYIIDGEFYCRLHAADECLRNELRKNFVLE